MRISLPLLLAACSDYQLGSTKDVELPTGHTGTVVDTTSTTTTPTTTPTTTTPTTTTPPVSTADTGPAPTCADAQIPVFAWRGSPTFAQQADPMDGSGLPFWDPAADTSAFVPVPTPDTAVPIGRDRAYVTTFDLTELPVNLSLDLQSDDGVWVWLNGTFVGHWGGEWQQEGCVNENAECLVTSEVDPIDVTALLEVGTNTIAARISNPVQSAYFEIVPLCVE